MSRLGSRILHWWRVSFSGHFLYRYSYIHILYAWQDRDCLFLLLFIIRRTSKLFESHIEDSFAARSMIAEAVYVYSLPKAENYKPVPVTAHDL
jgi:hypothetical protein